MKNAVRRTISTYALIFSGTQTGYIELLVYIVQYKKLIEVIKIQKNLKYNKKN